MLIRLVHKGNKSKAIEVKEKGRFRGVVRFESERREWENAYLEMTGRTDLVQPLRVKDMLNGIYLMYEKNVEIVR